MLQRGGRRDVSVFISVILTSSTYINMKAELTSSSRLLKKSSCTTFVERATNVEYGLHVEYRATS